MKTRFCGKVGALQQSGNAVNLLPGFRGQKPTFPICVWTLLCLFFVGCNGDMPDVGSILQATAGETEVDRDSIAFVHGDDLPQGVFWSRYVDPEAWGIFYTGDPSLPIPIIGRSRATAIGIPIWIADPKRKCLSQNDFTNGLTSFIEPSKLSIFDWHTGEKYTYHSPRWEGQPPEPRVSSFRSIPDYFDDLCPRLWFYFSSATIYLKYVDEDDKTSRKVGISTKDVGVMIDFKNGESLVWNLSEIYAEFPLMPDFIRE